MKPIPYRLAPDDQRDLSRLVNTSLFVDDGYGYHPPFVGKRDGTFEVLGTVFWVHVGELIHQNHINDVIQKITIQTNDWIWDGVVRVTIHDYSGGGKHYTRHFALDAIGEIGGDQDTFSRDVILLRMMRD